MWVTYLLGNKLFTGYLNWVLVCHEDVKSTYWADMVPYDADKNIGRYVPTYVHMNIDGLVCGMSKLACDNQNYQCCENRYVYLEPSFEVCCPVLVNPSTAWTFLFVWIRLMAMKPGKRHRVEFPSASASSQIRASHAYIPIVTKWQWRIR